MANYTAKIAGSLVNVVAGSLSVKNAIGIRSTGSLSVWSGLGTFWSYGTQMQIFDDTGALAYSGYVSKDKATKTSRQGQGYLEHHLTLMDNCYRADKRLVVGFWLNTPAGAIVQQIIGTTLAVEGVTTLPNSIAQGTTIQEAVFIYKPAKEALDWLAKQSGYWWNIDLNGVLWFQPYTGVPAPFVLDGTQVNRVSGLSVEYGNEQFTNRQFVKGAKGKTGTLTERLYGDGSKRAFTVSYPIASLTSLLLDGVDVTAHSLTKGGTGGQFYYAVGDAVIAQDPGQPLLTSSDYLDVTYKGEYPIIALAANNTLIAAQQAREGGGTGYVEAVYQNTKVHSQSAAFQIAGAILGHYGSKMTVLTFDTRVKGLAEGQSLTVNLSDFGLSSKQMLITEVEITDAVDQFNIWFHVMAVGSPYDTAQWQTYWQNLMNQSADPSDLSNVDDTSLAQLFQFTATLTWTGTATLSKFTCPICGPSTICGPSVIIC